MVGGFHGRGPRLRPRARRRIGPRHERRGLGLRDGLTETDTDFDADFDTDDACDFWYDRRAVRRYEARYGRRGLRLRERYHRRCWGRRRDARERRVEEDEDGPSWVGRAVAVIEVAYDEGDDDSDAASVAEDLDFLRNGDVQEPRCG